MTASPAPVTAPHPEPSETVRAPGRALDALIAEQVMGYTTSRSWASVGIDIAEIAPSDISVRTLPAYSTDIAAAWLVHLAMCERSFVARLRYFFALQEQTRLDTGALVAWPDVLVVLRDRFPEAICLAALAAVESSR